MTLEVQDEQPRRRKQITMGANPEDEKLLAKLTAKLGVSEADVFRIGIRRLAELEGIQ